MAETLPLLVEKLRANAAQITCVCGHSAEEDLQHLYEIASRVEGAAVFLFGIKDPMSELQYRVREEYRNHIARCPWVNSKWPEGAEL